MDALLNQLGLDITFFIEFGIFTLLFTILSAVYFRPFQKLFEARRKKTVEDREAAERLLAEANSKMDEYRRQLTDEKHAVKKGFDLALAEARKEESQLLAEARDEAKKITQEAADSINRQREELRKQLNADVEEMSQMISERLLSRKM